MPFGNACSNLRLFFWLSAQAVSHTAKPSNIVIDFTPIIVPFVMMDNFRITAFVIFLCGFMANFTLQA